MLTQLDRLSVLVNLRSCHVGLGCCDADALLTWSLRHTLQIPAQLGLSYPVVCISSRSWPEDVEVVVDLDVCNEPLIPLQALQLTLNLDRSDGMWLTLD